MAYNLVRRITRIWLSLRHQWFSRRYRRLVLEEVAGVPLIILPDVFNPVLFRTGEFLARSLATVPMDTATTVLDMGTGSGIGAVFAARRTARVVAVDVNPEAVRCAKLNALLNHFEDRIDVRCGDLFQPVADDRFDFVLFNPPYYLGQPKDNLDRAWRSEDVLERFAAGLGNHLTETGQAMIILSTDGEPQAALRALESNGFTIIPFTRRDFGNELLTIYSISRRP